MIRCRPIGFQPSTHPGADPALSRRSNGAPRRICKTIHPPLWQRVHDVALPDGWWLLTLEERLDWVWLYGEGDRHER